MIIANSNLNINSNFTLQINIVKVQKKTNVNVKFTLQVNIANCIRELTLQIHVPRCELKIAN